MKCRRLGAEGFIKTRPITPTLNPTKNTATPKKVEREPNFKLHSFRAFLLLPQFYKHKHRPSHLTEDSSTEAKEQDPTYSTYSTLLR